MKYIFLTLFLVHAALAAPHHVEEEIIDEDAMPMALPQIEEGVVEIKMAEDEEIEDDEEGDAESAFMRMVNSGRSHGGIPAFYYNMNRGMRSMMPQNTGAQGYGAQSYGSQGYGPQSYGMYNPMMNGYPGMGGYPGMDPMSQMMGGMGGYPGMDPMSQMMGGMGGYPGMDPMSQMMGGMGGYPGMDPMSQMMEMMSGMGGGMGGYPGMDMMGGGMGGYPGMNPMMNNYPGMGGYPGMDPMSQMMGGMGGMGGYPGMDMMGGMGNGMYPGMGGMGGYEDMSMGYMKEQPKNQHNAEYSDLKNEDYPTDYTLPCSDHCACDQVCKSKGPSCTCRCPPRCSSPGIIV